MKHKFYLLLFTLPLLLSFGSSNHSILKQDSVSLSNSENSSLNLINKWQVKGPAFFDAGRESYTLTLSPHFNFGHFIEFKEDNTFKAYYNASCGNDCFTKSNGTYIIKDDTVEIFVLSAQQTGFCSNPVSFSNKKIGTFKIIQKPKDTLLLKKI
jgi:hypothetical protein